MDEPPPPRPPDPEIEAKLNRAVWFGLFGFLARLGALVAGLVGIAKSPGVLFGAEDEDPESLQHLETWLFVSGALDLAALSFGCYALALGGMVWQVSSPNSRERRWLSLAFLGALAAVLGTRLGCTRVFVF